jgi:hypothetical protein
MSDLLFLSARQMARISGFFPLSHGVPWVDDRLVVAGDGGQPALCRMSRRLPCQHRSAAVGD